MRIRALAWRIPVKKELPARPHVEHLKGQAKALLSGVARGDEGAAAEVGAYLPAARGMTAAAVRGARWKLADMQSVVARQHGFGSWGQLVRHVEVLRGMEGTWAFARLEVEGQTIPAAAVNGSRLLIDGDRFWAQSPEARGRMTIDVEAEPHAIDLDFEEGPEAGNRNFGIFRLKGEEFEICLDMGGKGRPTGFGTTAGSGLAWEVLRRVSAERPEGVTGGKGAAAAPAAAPAAEPSGFAYVASATLEKLQGEWAATEIVKDGQALPEMMLRTAVRRAEKNAVKISFGGQVMIDVLVKVEEGGEVLRVDYLNVGGACKGQVQLGVMKWVGEEAWFCMGAPGGVRPGEFVCGRGSGRTLSRWRRKG